MKKKGFILLFLIFALGFPMRVFAEKINIADYNTLDLKGALEAEGITPKLDNYSENDEQITIYLFRRDGCQFCNKFLNYVNDTLISKYGNMFKIITSIRLKCCSNNKKYTKKDYIEVYIIFSFLYMNFFLFCTFL